MEKTITVRRSLAGAVVALTLALAIACALLVRGGGGDHAAAATTKSTHLSTHGWSPKEEAYLASHLRAGTHNRITASQARCGVKIVEGYYDSAAGFADSSHAEQAAVAVAIKAECL